MLNCGLKFEAKPQCRLSCGGLASSSFVCDRPIRLLSNLCKMTLLSFCQPKSLALRMQIGSLLIVGLVEVSSIWPK